MAHSSGIIIIDTRTCVRGAPETGFDTLQHVCTMYVHYVVVVPTQHTDP